MRPVLMLVLVLLASVSLEAPREVRAEVLAPGAYTGWIVQDRWGGVFLANGVYLLEFRGKAKDKALAWKDKPVRVDVTEMINVRDTTQGIGAVGTIEAAAPSYGGKLTLELQEPEICPPTPERQDLDVYLRYAGGRKLRLDCRLLTVVVRRIGKPLPGDADLKDPIFPAKDEKGTPWRAGGASMSVIEPGKRVRHMQVFRGFGGTFETEGAFRYRADLQLRLPPGEYDVFAVYDNRNLSRAPAPRTKMRRFDVIGKPAAK